MITVIHKHVSWPVVKFCQAAGENTPLDETKEYVLKICSVSY